MSGRVEDRLKELGELPKLVPPAGLEERTLAAMARATAPRRGRAMARAAVWVAALGAAALLAVLAFDIDTREQLADGAEAYEAETDDAAADALYSGLLAESVLLERVLYELPPPRRIMRVSTAGTIVGLENRIALIDAELVRAMAEADPPEYRTALLRDRVNAMNALVNVRYVQSRAFSF